MADMQCNSKHLAGTSLKFVICGLLAMFIFRVASQFIQLHTQVSFLPPFSQWQSGALPYQYLLPLQFVTILLMGYVAVLVLRGRLLPQWVGRIGVAYLVLMFGRFLAGETIYAGHQWLDAPLPSFFHWVIASFFLFSSRSALPNQVVSVLAIPVVLIANVWAYLSFVDAGIHPFLATCLPLTLGGLWIAGLESL